MALSQYPETAPRMELSNLSGSGVLGRKPVKGADGGARDSNPGFRWYQGYPAASHPYVATRQTLKPR